MKVDQLKVVETLEGVSVEVLDTVPPDDESRQLPQSLDHAGWKVCDEVGGEIKKTYPERNGSLPVSISIFMPHILSRPSVSRYQGC